MEVEVVSPFPFASIPRIWRWIEPLKTRVSDDFGPQTLEQFVSFASAKWKTQQTWAVYADGELGGLIVFERLSPWAGTAHWIFKADFQGKGIALRASRLAVAEMFAAGIGKLSIYPLAGPGGCCAIGGLLGELGATREGKLIGQTLCDGKPVDMLIFGLSKSQFEEKLNAVVSSPTPDYIGNRSLVVDHRGSGGGPHNDLTAGSLAGNAGAAAPTAGPSHR